MGRKQGEGEGEEEGEGKKKRFKNVIIKIIIAW
jgi:hypothetical protein